MNICVVCDGVHGSAHYVIQQLAPHSKHTWKIVQWNPDPHMDWADIVYVHYGGMINSRHPKYIKRLKDKRAKWIAGVRGMTNFRRWAHGFKYPPLRMKDFVHELSAISCANKKFEQQISPITDVPVYTCHSTIDTQTFVPGGYPEEFCIGWAGVSGSGAKRFGDFQRLPFKQVTSAIGQGTGRPFKEMPSFYPTASMYVSTSYTEGSAVPPKEAAACGLPVAAISTGDFPEWIPPEYLVPNIKDGWKALIPIIQRLKDDPELLRSEGQRFRQLSLQWDSREVVKEYDRMFDDILSTSSS